MIRTEDWGADLDIVRGEGSCTPVIWPGMGATERSIHLLLLGPRSRTIRMRHPSEAAYYVVDGEARIVDHDAGSFWPLVAVGMGVSVYHRDNPGLLVPFISADARFIIWLGTGAKTANMNYVVLQPGESNVPHVHELSEDTIFILEGHGSVRDYTAGTRLEFGPGDVIHIDAGVRHAVFADKAEVVVSVGGPCPADLGLLRLLGIDVDALLDA